jgi:hypothetical protein
MDTFKEDNQEKEKKEEKEEQKETSENISFLLEDACDDTGIGIDLHALQDQLNDFDIDFNSIQDAKVFMDMKDYELNYNVKQLSLICEYYGLRITKQKKQDIIEQIVIFENTMENIVITMKRKELWYYINELKNDKMMKKFVIWS